MIDVGNVLLNVCILKKEPDITEGLESDTSFYVEETIERTRSCLDPLYAEIPLL